MQLLEKISETLGGIVWGNGMLLLILGTGMYLTVRTGFFQLRKFPLILRKTIVSIFKDKEVTKSGDHKTLSQFQAMSTALAATMGTGNIAGVATALTLGGPGAIFWMWLSAFFGMMTVFGENVLGLYHRYKNSKGEWTGGPMVYIEKGLGAKPLGKAYALFCVLASFGMGNMAQVNSISTALDASFRIPPLATGIAAALLVGIILLGGIKRIGKVTEKIIPFVSLAYILGAILIIVINFKSLPAVFQEIFQGAFGFDAAAGGISGALVKQAVSVGFRRGVFSNEAGLGSSVMVHAASDIKEPVHQGMWAVFEVFLDTIVCCTLTALAVLSTGVLGGTGAGGAPLDGAPLVIAAFESGFGRFAGVFVSVSVALFAFATLLGWSFYGSKAVEYLFGEKSVGIYKLIFAAVIIAGAVAELKVVWGLSDVLNGLMAVPNLIALLLLSKTVTRETKSYLSRIKSK